MRKDRNQEQEIIDFLMSYPEAIPSQAQKARTIAQVQREIRSNQPVRLSSMDVLFTCLLLAAALVLYLFSAWLPEFYSGQILIQFYQLRYFPHILFYFGLTGCLTVPLLLTILPIKKGGNQ